MAGRLASLLQRFVALPLLAELGTATITLEYDVLEPLTHRGHVRERLVDVEDEEDRSPGTVRAHRVVHARKVVGRGSARHVRHRSSAERRCRDGASPSAQPSSATATVDGVSDVALLSDSFH